MRRRACIGCTLAVVALALLFPFLQPLLVVAQAPTPSWSAQYWPNPDFISAPALQRQEAEVNFAWGQGGPSSALTDNFSARFVRRVTFGGGLVKFFARSDDGVRVWVDEALLIDKWYVHPASEVYTTVADIRPGTYTIRVDYYDRLDDATLQVWWEEIPPERVGSWYATYWPNQNLAGPATLTAMVPEINFEWGAGSPSLELPRDTFSARYTRTLELEEGNYRFFVRADDGVRVWVGSQRVIDRWMVSPAQVYQSNVVPLGAGTHTVQVEYFEGTGDAALQFWWERLAPPPTPTPQPRVWRGEYFSNRELFGMPQMVTMDPAIDFNWGQDGPMLYLPSDNFSVRWSQRVEIPAGNYEFVVEADDGVRVRMDETIAIDMWTDGPRRGAVGVLRNVTAGTHTIVVEYYERTGLANIKLGWRRLP